MVAGIWAVAAAGIITAGAGAAGIIMAGRAAVTATAGTTKGYI